MTKVDAAEPVQYEQSYNLMEEIIKAEKQELVDHPKRTTYPRNDIPLDRYQQEILWNACQEWDVPYELALAVCWRETNFRNLETPYDGEMYYGMMAVQGKSAKWYMEQCGVEYLNSEEDRLRVGCCILGQHIKDYGSIEAALCRYSNDYNGWYAESVMNYMEKLMAA